MIPLRKDVVVFLVAFLAASAHVATSECVAPYNEVEHHTACQEPSPDLDPADIVLEDEEKTELLNEHNIKRAMVAEAGATDMLKMYWNDEAAMLAQKWAETCETGHDLGERRAIPGKYGHGQNMYGSTVKPTMAEVVEAWYSEIHNFTFGAKPANDAVVGHFTQVAWSSSNLLGCGIAKCSGRTYAWSVVCNYAIAGNSYTAGDPNALYRPYTPGTKCASCPDTCTAEGLCDCNMNSGDVKMCYAGGKLHPDTCTCLCKYDKPWITDQCDVDCDKVPETEPSYCTSEAYATACTISNWPYEYCPRFCGLCEATSSNTSEKRGTSKVNNLAKLLLKILSNKMHE